MRRVGVFGCLNVAMPACTCWCTFIVNREATRSLSDFFCSPARTHHDWTFCLKWHHQTVAFSSYLSPFQLALFPPRPLILSVMLSLLDWKHLKDNYPCGLGRCRDEDIFFISGGLSYVLVCPPEGDLWGRLVYYPWFLVTFTHMQLFPNYLCLLHGQKYLDKGMTQVWLWISHVQTKGRTVLPK